MKKLNNLEPYKKKSFALIIIGGIIGLSFVWLREAYPNSYWLSILGLLLLAIGGCIAMKGHRQI